MNPREAVDRGEEAAFREALEALYTARPEDLLLAAWHYRLQAYSLKRCQM